MSPATSGYAAEVLERAIRLEEASLDPADPLEVTGIMQALRAFAEDVLALDPPPVPFAAQTRLARALDAFLAGVDEAPASFSEATIEEVGAAQDRLTLDALAIPSVSRARGGELGRKPGWVGFPPSSA